MEKAKVLSTFLDFLTSPFHTSPVTECQGRDGGNEVHLLVEREKV